MNTNAENPAIATPLVSFPKRSLKAPPTTAKGQEANTPAKNRHSIKVWKSFAVAAANMKHVHIKQAPVIGTFTHTTHSMAQKIMVPLQIHRYTMSTQE
jgi:hypothetical protein